ncbi:MAG TPA: BamA/TamA family outer membrane protein [Longimicrobiales bacterium]|nr:BamA/TamA family outer membrane protein [Longimicrobiales bacterium]
MTATLLLLLLSALPASSQEPTARRPAAAAGDCDEGVISHLFIDTHSIFDTSDPDLDPRLRWAYRIANSLHVRTRPSVIRQELLFTEGDCYDPQVLEDSERLLRALGFLARVDIYGVRQADGTWHVIVDTQDEWSTKAEVRLDLSDEFTVEGLRIEETNLAGTGQYAELFFTDRSLARSYGAAYATPHMLGTRWDLALAGGSSHAGTFFEQALTFPFVGEVGRWAARQSFRRRDRYFDLVAAEAPEVLVESEPEEIHLLVPQREKSMELSLVRRFGRRGGLSLMGGALSFQEVSYPGGREGSILVLGEELADSAAASDALLDPVWTRLEALENIRAFVLVGHRSVYWIERSRLDALRATQDVRLGAEIGLALGRSLPGLETADDLFTTLTFFAGSNLTRYGVATAELRLDARRDFDGPVGATEWEDVIGAARLLSYWRTEALPRHTLVIHASGAGGWHNRRPFQLTLGGDHALRGYEPQRFPGGRMVVGGIENRIYLGWPFPDLLDIGLTVFADAGVIWAGDLPYPYGEYSGLRGSAGFGLRTNFPAGGRTTYRLDFAAPVGDGMDLGDVRILLSIGEPISLSSRADRAQVARSRMSGVSGDVFNFPR